MMGQAYVTRGARLRRLYDKAVQKQLAEQRAAEERRANDPVERAKTHLRREGFVCYCASVHRGGSSRHTVVGRRVLDDTELLAFARRKGFEG